MTKKGTDHKAHLARINRIEGQIRGIGKMIEGEKYCINILTQFKAVRSALKSLEHKILESHLNHCVKDAVVSKSKDNIDVKIEEIMKLLKSVN